MLAFERTRDAELIQGVVRHPRVFGHMFADDGPAPEDYAPRFDAAVYFAVRIGGALAGVFICLPQTSVCWDVHVCLLPHARLRATEIYREGLAWLGATSECRKVTGHIPAYNRAALLVATGAGAEVIGINKGSIMKNGRLEDQIIVGRAL